MERYAFLVIVGLVVVASFPYVLKAFGFTRVGIVAGSIAASMMSISAVASGGGVTAGSVVAFLQSAGAVGLGALGNTVLGGIVAFFAKFLLGD